ncbi:sugar phosphate isomerase/epimerase [Pontiellaceae bacterium B12227]|nr:sugar phosphate isomerase/epimerase [Pontiellaceae bacterium B12227]
MKLSTGMCTWSLQNNPFEVVKALKEAGLSMLHLELVALELFRELIKENNLTVSCTMLAFPQEDYSTLHRIRETGGIVPDDCWPVNRVLVIDAIEKTAKLNVKYLSFHAGFIDHTDTENYQLFCGRMTEVADAAKEHGIMILLETGQESAGDLRIFLEELNHPALGVNFDPANMILYGKGNPIDAVHRLAPWIKHVHIKDATASPNPDEWGTEVPWGDGEVGPENFFKALADINYSGALAIEREAGDQRRKDMVHAAKQLEMMK